MEASKRVRLRFRDDDILTETQKSDGLDRSWFLLKTRQHVSVSDVAGHLLDAFQLHQSCPQGLLLSISGFVLPPFESTSILKDNEIISVRKRKPSLLIEGNNASDEVKKLKAAVKQPVNSSVLLLANEEFEKEKGGYESDDMEEENEEGLLADIAGPSGVNRETKIRKRKAAEKLQGSMRKKQRSEAAECATNKVQTEKTENSLQERDEESSDSSEEDSEENIGESAKSSDKNNASKSGMKRSLSRNEEENDKGDADPNVAPQEKRKLPSRSARRKYVKRRWLKEMKKIQKQNMNCESEGLRNWKEDQAKAQRNKAEKGKPKWKNQGADVEKNDDGQPKGLLHWVQSPQDNSFVRGKKCGRRNQNAYFSTHPSENGRVKKLQNQKSDEYEQHTQNGSGLEQSNQKEGNVAGKQIQENLVEEDPNQNRDASEKSEESSEENEVVPIEIRPGHIRFEPLGKESKQAVQKNHAPSEIFQWNGITSKKKGQQWGQENNSFTPRSNIKNSSQVYFEILDNEKDKQPGNEKENQPGNEKDTEPGNGKERQSDARVDFEKLPPLTSTPKDGDVIAYRLLELSSSWTPELSALRVGKVSWYDAGSNQILLVPVPEYPISQKKANEDEAGETNNSLYKEDCSLEIDFPSLIDARIFNNEKSATTNESLGSTSETIIGDENTSETVLPSSNDQQEVAPNPENAESNQGKETELLNSDAGGTSIWDQISEALNAKKEELSKENGWGKTPKKVHPFPENKWGDNAKIVKPSPQNSWGKNTPRVQSSQGGSAKQSPGSKPWSYRAMRGGALGPTMALLRSKKDAQG